MKKGILGVLMAAVAVLFLVEVSMETVFTRTRIQQTMAYSDVEAADETAPEVLTVLVMGEEPERLQYLLLCGIRGDGSVGLVSVAPETLLRCAGDGQLRTAAELCCADGPKGLLRTLRYQLGISGQDYIAVSVESLGRIAAELGEPEEALNQEEQQILLDVQRDAAGALESCGEEAMVTLASGMVKSVRGLSPARLPGLIKTVLAGAETNIGLGQLLRCGRDYLSGGDRETALLYLPGSLPAVWSGEAEEARRCSWPLGQGAGMLRRFYGEK